VTTFTIFAVFSADVTDNTVVPNRLPTCSVNCWA